MIKIFYCNSDNTSIPTDISKHRLDKICSSIRDKQVMINAARVLKAGFSSFGITESSVIYGLGEHGKPHAVNYPNIHFSLSHSHNLAIVAFSDKKTGIDCEKAPKNISTHILKRFFTDSEQAAFADSPLQLWVSKEATVKYTGKGFAAGRNDFQIPPFKDAILFDGVWLKRISIVGYECVLCSSEPDEIEIKGI